MKPSWSQRLFFVINQRIGARPWLDKSMIFAAKWLVIVMCTVWTLWVLQTHNVAFAFRAFRLLFVIYAIAFIASYLIGFFIKKKRPARQFPSIKTLIKPLGSWKSFPSDHTIIVTGMVLTLGILSAPVWFVAGFALAAALVAVGRVYAGVHYPSDILGGLIVATISCLLALLLLW